MIEVFEVNEKEYYYKAFRVLNGFLLIHNWNSPEGKVVCISIPYKLLSFFIRYENNNKFKNRASTLGFLVRFWRFELSTGIGWHNDPWTLIL
jgi:hypothetical protein